MTSMQGDIALLTHPIAEELLRSTNPARLAYVWRDGTPRVVPIWFHWDGQDIVMSSPANAPKVEALKARPPVALTIDGNAWPYPVLMVRGNASIEYVDEAPSAYALAARRYLGDEGGTAFVAQFAQLPLKFVRIALRPEWVAVLDFQQRFPNAVETAMEQHVATQTASLT